jgi:biopolymer transport protein ExbD
MLVLLIIFMVVTPFLQQGISVALPRDMKNPDEDQAINKESAVIISIPKDGDYYLGKKKVNLEDLKTSVEKALANKKEEDKIVYIKSGVEVSYGEVVKVINAVREKGVDKIGLVADKKKKSGGAAAPAPAT